MSSSILHRLSVLFLCGSLVFLSACDAYKQSTPEEFGESMYLALKNNDLDGMRELYLSPDQIDAVLAAAESTGKSTLVNRETLESILEGIAEVLPDELARLRDRGTKEGVVDWAQLDFKGVDVKSADQVDGLETAWIKVYFTSADKDFELDCGRIRKVEGAWYTNASPELNRFIKF